VSCIELLLAWPPLLALLLLPSLLLAPTISKYSSKPLTTQMLKNSRQCCFTPLLLVPLLLLAPVVGTFAGCNPAAI
jgi:hypothetical protein